MWTGLIWFRTGPVKLRFEEEGENVLYIWDTISDTRRTLLHGVNMDFGNTSFYMYLLTATSFLYTTVLAELEIGQMEQTSRPLRFARTTNVPCVYRQAGSFVSSAELRSTTYNFTYQIVCFSWEKEVKYQRPPTHINNRIYLGRI